VFKGRSVDHSLILPSADAGCCIKRKSVLVPCFACTNAGRADAGLITLFTCVCLISDSLSGLGETRVLDVLICALMGRCDRICEGEISDAVLRPNALLGRNI